MVPFADAEGSLRCHACAPALARRVTSACMEMLHTFETPKLGLFLWLLEMMADVAEKHTTNRMSAQAIAIVVAPNLYDPPGLDGSAGAVLDPLAALTYTQGMSKFVTELLSHYISIRSRVRSASLPPGALPPDLAAQVAAHASANAPPPSAAASGSADSTFEL